MFYFLLFVKLMQLQIDTHFFFLESTAISPTSTFQPPPRVEHLGNGQICVNCPFLVPSVNACVIIVHSTHNTSNLFGKQLKVYSVNRSVVYDCFQVAEDEYHVAVFGLLNTGLERVPVVKTFIRRTDFSTTSSGQFKPKVHIRINMSIIVRQV